MPRTVVGFESLLFCPLCGTAWEHPPGDRIDSINSLSDFAGDGVRVPSEMEVRASGVPVVEVSWQEWLPLLQAEAERDGIKLEA